MTTLRDLYSEIERRVNNGERLEVATADVAQLYQDEVCHEFVNRTIDRMRLKFKKEWQNPPIGEDMHQLSFEFDGAQFEIPDWRVRIVNDDNSVTHIAAKFSTAQQRRESNEALIQYHRKMQHIVETEHGRGLKQDMKMERAGFDMTLTWDAQRFRDVICGRCLEGWREGDPFELGHYDAPASRGGTKVRWEHQSCNRSAKANPVACPVEFDES
jgi:predicted RNA methylase